VADLSALQDKIAECDYPEDVSTCAGGKKFSHRDVVQGYVMWKWIWPKKPGKS